MADLEDEDSAVQDFLTVLEEHRKNCESEGKYVEAEIARNRLEELRLHEENRRREAMRSRQIAERLGVEEAHMLEFQQFNKVWDEKMQMYEENAANLMANLKARHKGSLQEFQETLISKPLVPKFSKELLNLRKIQQHLAHQKDYAEAHKMKLKADSLEGWELEKQQNERQEQVRRLWCCRVLARLRCADVDLVTLERPRDSWPAATLQGHLRAGDFAALGVCTAVVLLSLWRHRPWASCRLVLPRSHPNPLLLHSFVAPAALQLCSPPPPIVSARS
jgi:hypothetical protein